MNRIHDVNIHQNRNSFGNRVSYILNYTLDNTIGFNLYPRMDSNLSQRQSNNVNLNNYLNSTNIQNQNQRCCNRLHNRDLRISLCESIVTIIHIHPDNTPPQYR